MDGTPHEQQRRRQIIRGTLPYFGSKREMGPEIAAEFGAHRAYWSLFGGSLADLFAKEPCGQETVNDLHGDVINLTMVLASPRWAELADRTKRSLFGDPLFEAAKRWAATLPAARAAGEGALGYYRPPRDPSEVSEADLERAYWFFVLSWMGRNGTAGSACSHNNLCLRWTATGGSSSVRFAAAADSVAWMHQRLRRVQILWRDAFVVAPSIEDAEGVVVYSDSPYLLATRGKGGGSRYLFDFAETTADPDAHPLVRRYGDHGRLALELRRFKRARVVASHYDHPALDELYPAAEGWTKRLMYREKHLSIVGRDAEPTTAPEVLLLNGPSYAAGRAAAAAEEPSLFGAAV